MPKHEIPFVGFERGYFLDIQCFFPEKELIGHKILSGPCNVNCYYCHRVDFLYAKYPMVPIDDILNKLRNLEYYNTIVVTGGEITLFHLPALRIMKRLQHEGITTLFSTNGSFPDRVREMVPHADVVKIDIKGHKSQYERIAGKDIYDSALRSISIASRKTNVEVKLILHSYTRQEHINQILYDVYEQTGMPPNLAIEFQPVRDFLGIGIAEPYINNIMEICASAKPLPAITLLKHYGEKEHIYRLDGGGWKVFREKEIPLRFNWANSNDKKTTT